MSHIQAEKSEMNLFFYILIVQKQTNQQRKKKDKTQYDYHKNILDFHTGSFLVNTWVFCILPKKKLLKI